MLELKNISKRYDYKKVIYNVNISFPDTGMIGIIGDSGCGKTTLLNIIGGIDNDFSGDLVYNGKSVKSRLDWYRKKYVTFIFQNNHLINWLTPFKNVSIGKYFKSVHKGVTYNHDIDCLEEKVAYLSLGQRGMVSYLRAFFYDKDIILADEPTGAMDYESGKELMENIKKLSEDRLVILVSHDLEFVESYCDEIYYIKDGCIENHIVKNQVHSKERDKQKVRKILFPLIRLSFHSIMSHKKRTFQMIVGVILSMLCILCTLTISFNIENSIYNYIYSLVPPSSVSVLSHKEIDSVLYDQISMNENVERFHLFLDNCELLGVSFDKGKYKYSSTLFIHDDSSPYSNIPLKLGNYPKDNNEILVSLSTAKHLSGEKDLNELINKKIYAWYKIYQSCISVEYTISGITALNTQADVIYQRDNAYVSMLKNKGIDVKMTYGLVYLKDSVNRESIIKEFEYNYKDMDFKASGASTLNHAKDLFDKVKGVLFIFSSLIIISSVILIGEVTYLNVNLKRKDFAIMKCFGANTFELIKLIILESVEIMCIATVFVIMFYYSFLYILNTLFNEVLLMEGIVVKGYISHIVIVILCGFALMIISQMVSMLYIVKLNTHEALKN